VTHATFTITEFAAHLVARWRC